MVKNIVFTQKVGKDQYLFYIPKEYVKKYDIEKGSILKLTPKDDFFEVQPEH